MNDSMRHASPEELALLQLGEISPDAERELREHLQSCGLCQAELALAADFVADTCESAGELRQSRMREHVGAVVGNGTGTAHGRPRRRRGLERLLMAAAVVFAAVGIYELRPHTLPTGPGEVLRSADMAASIDLGVSLRDDGWLLSWTVNGGGEGQRVRIRSMRGEELWVADVSGSEFLISFDQPELEGVPGPFFAGVLRAAEGITIESNLVTLERK